MSDRREERPSPRGRKRKKGDLVVIVDVRKLVRFTVLAVLCLLTLLSLISVARRFMTVKHFEMEGIASYEVQDLINASGLKRGDRLYGFDREEVEARILKECPYLEWVRVKTDFPSTVRFLVEGKQAQWYIEVGEACYALDGDLVVVSETHSTQGLTKLVLPHLSTVRTGQVPSFGESETEIKKTLELISAIRQTTFKARLSEVDLTSRWDIHLTVDGSYSVTVGDMSDFSAKLRAVEAILNSETGQRSVGGSIDVSVPASPAFSPVFPKEE